MGCVVSGVLRFRLLSCPSDCSDEGTHGHYLMYSDTSLPARARRALYHLLHSLLRRIDA